MHLNPKEEIYLQVRCVINMPWSKHAMNSGTESHRECPGNPVSTGNYVRGHDATPKSVSDPFRPPFASQRG
ncbi:hypothetical protein CJU90_3659 [Yarrowia sp. C11]|nr:hypothetical protein CJU90_3659 [Yarrowia sp. C11]